MRADLKGGKTVITLHEADKRALNKASEIMGFVGRNERRLVTVTDTVEKGIDCVLQSLCAVTPENDTGQQVEKQPAKKDDTQLAKTKVA